MPDPIIENSQKYKTVINKFFEGLKHLENKEQFTSQFSDLSKRVQIEEMITHTFAGALFPKTPQQDFVSYHYANTPSGKEC